MNQIPYFRQSGDFIAPGRHGAVVFPVDTREGHQAMQRGATPLILPQLGDDGAYYRDGQIDGPGLRKLIGCERLQMVPWRSTFHPRYDFELWFDEDGHKKGQLIKVLSGAPDIWNCTASVLCGKYVRPYGTVVLVRAGTVVL